LPGLDIVGEVVIDPAGISKVGNLDADDVAPCRLIDLALIAG
jgi:hypothetical protein